MWPAGLHPGMSMIRYYIIKLVVEGLNLLLQRTVGVEKVVVAVVVEGLCGRGEDPPRLAHVRPVMVVAPVADTLSTRD